MYASFENFQFRDYQPEPRLSQPVGPEKRRLDPEAHVEGQHRLLCILF